MGMNTRLSLAARNAVTNAVCGRCNGGYLRFYAGPRRGRPDQAIVGTLLAELRFAQKAFKDAENGSAESYPLSVAIGKETGVPSWFAVCDEAGSPVYDGDCGPQSNAAFDRDMIKSGVEVTCRSITYTTPMQDA